MDIQRLRNLTMGLLHTDMSCIYHDIEYLTGEKGIMTHHLPRALRALQPILKERELPKDLFEKVYLPDEVGEINVPPFNATKLAKFWANF